MLFCTDLTSPNVGPPLISDFLAGDYPWMILCHVLCNETDCLAWGAFRSLHVLLPENYLKFVTPPGSLPCMLYNAYEVKWVFIFRRYSQVSPEQVQRTVRRLPPANNVDAARYFPIFDFERTILLWVKWKPLVGTASLFELSLFLRHTVRWRLTFLLLNVRSNLIGPHKAFLQSKQV